MVVRPARCRQGSRVAAALPRRPFGLALAAFSWLGLHGSYRSVSNGGGCAVPVPWRWLESAVHPSIPQDERKRMTHALRLFLWLQAQLRLCCVFGSGFALDVPSPAVAPRRGAGRRGKANCLRPWMAELFAGRWLASTAGDRADAVRPARLPGCPFLCLLSFGQAKESRALAAEASGTSRQHHQERAKNQGKELDPGLRRDDGDGSRRGERNLEKTPPNESEESTPRLWARAFDGRLTPPRASHPAPVPKCGSGGRRRSARPSSLRPWR